MTIPPVRVFFLSMEIHSSGFSLSALQKSDLLDGTAGTKIEPFL